MSAATYILGTYILGNIVTAAAAKTTPTLRAAAMQTQRGSSAQLSQLPSPIDVCGGGGGAPFGVYPSCLKQGARCGGGAGGNASADRGLHADRAGGVSTAPSCSGRAAGFGPGGSHTDSQGRRNIPTELRRLLPKVG